LFLIGRSLGGAVTTHLLTDPKVEASKLVKGVIIENTFAGISEMADSLFPFLKLVPSLKRRMMRLNFDSLARVQKFDSSLPVFFISGDIDTFVPTAQTIMLHEKCSSKQKELWIVPGGNHNDTWLKGMPEYAQRLQAFMKRCRGEETKKDQ